VQLLLASVLIAAGILAAGLIVGGRIAAAAAADAARARRAQLLAMFAPAIAAAAVEPRALLTWQPIAAAARALFPDDFVALDRAAGRPFPFSADDLQAAHARWSAEWLAWEQAHDADYKLKAAIAAEELQRSGGSALVRARCENVEREKLELYQRRYEEYTRVSKALKALGEAQKIG
jgi:hypothetical protein